MSQSVTSKPILKKKHYVNEANSILTATIPEFANSQVPEHHWAEEYHP